MYYLLLPFRALLRPALAQDGTSFLLSLVRLLGLLALAYLWVIRSDASFEEAALERSEKAAQRLEARKPGLALAQALRSRRVRRPPFPLEPEGLPFVAIFWKNLISSGQLRFSRLLALALAILAADGLGGRRGQFGPEHRFQPWSEGPPAELPCSWPSWVPW